MFTQQKVLRGSERRKARAQFNMAAFTRSEAEAFISGSDDPGVIAKFANHPNKHVQHKATKRSESLQIAAEKAAKRSAAAKKAAETRRLKKLAAEAAEEAAA